MPRRIRTILAATAVAGALAVGTAVVAEAATSGGSSTTVKPSTTPKAVPPARPKGAHPCPHMGSGASGASDSSGGYTTGI